MKQVGFVLVSPAEKEMEAEGRRDEVVDAEVMISLNNEGIVLIGDGGEGCGFRRAHHLKALTQEVHEKQRRLIGGCKILLPGSGHDLLLVLTVYFGRCFLKKRAEGDLTSCFCVLKCYKGKNKQIRPLSVKRGVLQTALSF